MPNRYSDTEKHLKTLESMRSYRENKMERLGFDNSHIRAEIGALKHAEASLTAKLEAMKAQRTGK